jgi:drug/metabolite transporter (DMT)-like permease
MVATRFVIEQTTPASLALLRYGIGLACLLPLALAAGRLRIDRRDLLPVALLGIAQFGILIVLLNYGLRFLPSARAALIFATFPLQTLVIAALLGRESVTAAKLAGVMLTILGVSISLGATLAHGTAESGEWIGAAAVFASALCGALCSVLYRPYVRKYPTLPVSTFAMGAAVVFLAGLAAADGFFARWPSLTLSGWGAVAFIGASSGIGYYLWLWALANLSPTRVAVFLALGPVTAAILGAVFLDEAVTASLGLGIACVATGLWAALRSGDHDGMAQT